MILPSTIKERFEVYPSLAHPALRKDFSAFMRDAIKIAKVFELVDNGKTKSERAPTLPFGGRNLRDKFDKKQNKHA